MPELASSSQQIAAALELLSDIRNELASIRNEVSELHDVVRVLADPLLSIGLQQIFDDPKQLLAYELSDGKRSTREIGSIVGVDQKTISTWWRGWKAEHAIVEKTGKRGQYERRLSLVDLMVRYSDSLSYPTVTFDPNGEN
jgi:hypothetical protein